MFDIYGRTCILIRKHTTNCSPLLVLSESPPTRSPASTTTNERKVNKVFRFSMFAITPHRHKHRPSISTYCKWRLISHHSSGLSLFSVQKLHKSGWRPLRNKNTRNKKEENQWLVAHVTPWPNDIYVSSQPLLCLMWSDTFDRYYDWT